MIAIHNIRLLSRERSGENGAAGSERRVALSQTVQALSPNARDGNCDFR